jgi:hypothetical protein
VISLVQVLMITFAVRLLRRGGCAASAIGVPEGVL